MEDILSAIDDLVEEARISGAHPGEPTNYREAHDGLIAAVESYASSVALAQRERDAGIVERRASEIEDGQDAASVSAWFARVLRDEAKAIRAQP